MGDCFRIFMESTWDIYGINAVYIYIYKNMGYIGNIYGICNDMYIYILYIYIFIFMEIDR